MYSWYVCSSIFDESSDTHIIMRTRHLNIYSMSRLLRCAICWRPRQESYKDMPYLVHCVRPDIPSYLQSLTPAKSGAYSIPDFQIRCTGAFVAATEATSMPHTRIVMARCIMKVRCIPNTTRENAFKIYSKPIDLYFLVGGSDRVSIRNTGASWEVCESAVRMSCILVYIGINWARRVLSATEALHTLSKVYRGKFQFWTWPRAQNCVTAEIYINDGRVLI